MGDLLAALLPKLISLTGGPSDLANEIFLLILIFVTKSCRISL